MTLEQDACFGGIWLLGKSAFDLTNGIMIERATTNRGWSPGPFRIHVIVAVNNSKLNGSLFGTLMNASFLSCNRNGWSRVLVSGRRAIDSSWHCIKIPDSIGGGRYFDHRERLILYP